MGTKTTPTSALTLTLVLVDYAFAVVVFILRVECVAILYQHNMDEPAPVVLHFLELKWSYIKQADQLQSLPHVWNSDLHTRLSAPVPVNAIFPAAKNQIFPPHFNGGVQRELLELAHEHVQLLEDGSTRKRSHLRKSAVPHAATTHHPLAHLENVGSVDRPLPVRSRLIGLVPTEETGDQVEKNHLKGDTLKYLPPRASRWRLLLLLLSRNCSPFARHSCTCGQYCHVTTVLFLVNKYAVQLIISLRCSLMLLIITLYHSMHSRR